MNELTISEREQKLLMYQMAWIRSRNFSVERDQDTIRNFFSQMFKFEATRPIESMLLKFHRSIFVLENEGNNREKVVLKESDYTLMAIFLSEYIAHVESGLPVLERDAELFTKPSLDILIKGFSTLLIEKILTNRYLKKYTIQQQKDFVLSIKILLTKLVEVVSISTSKTAIKKALKETKTVHELSIDSWEQGRIEAETASKEVSETTLPATTTPPVETKQVKKKPVSAFTKKEIKEHLQSMYLGESELSEEDQLKVIKHIAKSHERIYDFINHSNADYFIGCCFNNKIPMEIDITSRFYSLRKELLDEKIAALQTSSKLEERIKTYLFNKHNFDWQEIAEEFLEVYKNNGMELTDKMLEGEKSLLSFDSYIPNDSPFKFGPEDLDLLDILLWISQRQRSILVKIEEDKLSFSKKNLSSIIRPNTGGFLIPSTSNSWGMYGDFARMAFELFINNDFQLNEEQEQVRKHLLSLVQAYEVSNLHSDIVLEYKIQNYKFTANEFAKFISKLDLKRRDEGISSKIFFNKKLSKHILEVVSGFYSKLTDPDKGFIFSKIEEATLLEWLKVLDPDILLVAQIMPNSLGDNLNTLLTQMIEVKAKNGSFGLRKNPQYL